MCYKILYVIKFVNEDERLYISLIHKRSSEYSSFCVMM